MTVTLGVSAGFVTEAPVADPTGAVFGALNNACLVMKDTSPVTEGKITEIGFWIDNATVEANFEVGLYAADGATIPGEAGTLLNVERTNAKGTDAGWKRVTVDWTISAETIYWLGMQIDGTGNANTNRELSGGPGIDFLVDTSLPDPFGGGTLFDSNGIIALYAVWEVAAAGTNAQINIGDVWKAVPAMQINIGDVWKAVAGAQINIGDAWKTVF